MTCPVQPILDAMRREAERAPFPLDGEVYERFGRSPVVPIAFAGNPQAGVCSFGRDLGRDEVRLGQPQVGAAGRQVRLGVLEAAGIAPESAGSHLEAALEHVFLSNTVPYKPPGNKAYPDRVKERFRPYVARLLACFWTGDRVITLGTEAFQWFAPYGEPGAAEAFWRRDDRYEAEFPCRLRAETPEGSPVERPLTVCPLPHPSPLNQRWFQQFPELLRRRLEGGL